MKGALKVHRVAGLMSVVLVLFISATGMLLNHSEDLGLHEGYVENPVMIRAYGFNRGGEDGYLEEPPTWEMVITSLHSGRFLGAGRVAYVDILGILLVLIALSGLVAWCRRLYLLKQGASGQLDEESLEESLMEKAEQLRKVREVSRGLLRGVKRIHDISEHIMVHVKKAPDRTQEREKDVAEIEMHLVELDSRMHDIIGRLERLQKDIKQE